MSDTNEPQGKVREHASPFAEIAVDVSRCNLFELSVTLNEYDKPDAAPDTWPDVVKAKVLRYLTHWREKNPHSEIVLMSHGVVAASGNLPGACCVAIHHRKRG